MTMRGYILYLSVLGLPVGLLLVGALSILGGVILPEPIDPAEIGDAGGHAWVYPLHHPLIRWGLFTSDADFGFGDVLITSASRLRLLEDGKALGPPHSLHDTTIRLKGRGAFSHIHSNSLDFAKPVLVFSSSDNSNPCTNGRHYLALYPIKMAPGVFFGSLALLLLAIVGLARGPGAVLAWLAGLGRERERLWKSDHLGNYRSSRALYDGATAGPSWLMVSRDGAWSKRVTRETASVLTRRRLRWASGELAVAVLAAALCFGLAGAYDEYDKLNTLCDGLGILLACYSLCPLTDLVISLILPNIEQRYISKMIREESL